MCTILETETRLMLFIAVAYPGPSSQLRTCVDGVSRSTEAEDELPIIVAAFLEVFHSKYQFSSQLRSPTTPTLA